MNKEIVKDGFVWGFALWLIGYILGIIFFAFIPPAIMGWFIMPIGILISIWVLNKKIKSRSLNHYLSMGIIWAFIAIILDYLFIVKLLKPADGYYKTDVYFYYITTFVLPLIVGQWKIRNKHL